MYPCPLCQGLIDYRCVGLFLDFQFYSIYLYVYSYIDTTVLLLLLLCAKCWNQDVWLLHLCFSFSRLFYLCGISCKLVWILNSALNKCLQERLSRFGKDCIISFEYYWVLLGFQYYFHRKNTKLSNWYTWIYFHLFTSLIPLSKVLFFSVQVLYIFGQIYS